MAVPKRKVTLKLLIDRKTQRVLFAEAGKDFVDFLFSIMSLPLGTVISLLTTGKGNDSGLPKGMDGCLPNLYHSIEDLNDNFVLPNQHKDVLLKPKYLPSISPQVSLLDIDDDYFEKPVSGPWLPLAACAGIALSFFCPQLLPVVAIVAGTAVRPVRSHVAAKNQCLAGCFDSADELGFVKGVVTTYMVTDDLVVEPMSMVSIFALLNRFHVKEVGTLEKKVVEIGMDEGLGLLKNALATKSVLTNVFLGDAAGWEDLINS